MAAGKNSFSSQPAWEPQAQLLPTLSELLVLGFGSPVYFLGEGSWQCWCLETCLAWHFVRALASWPDDFSGMSQMLALVTA